MTRKDNINNHFFINGRFSDISNLHLLQYCIDINGQYFGHLSFFCPFVYCRMRLY